MCRKEPFLNTDLISSDMTRDKISKSVKVINYVFQVCPCTYKSNSNQCSLSLLQSLSFEEFQQNLIGMHFSGSDVEYSWVPPAKCSETSLLQGNTRFHCSIFRTNSIYSKLDRETLVLLLRVYVERSGNAWGKKDYSRCGALIFYLFSKKSGKSMRTYKNKL